MGNFPIHNHMPGDVRPVHGWPDERSQERRIIMELDLFARKVKVEKNFGSMLIVVYQKKNSTPYAYENFWIPVNAVVAWLPINTKNKKKIRNGYIKQIDVVDSGGSKISVYGNGISTIENILSQYAPDFKVKTPNQLAQIASFPTRKYGPEDYKKDALTFIKEETKNK